MTYSPWSARLLILLAALISLGSFATIHGLQPEAQPDTGSYQKFDWSTLQSTFSNKRTCGYPAFLALVNSISTDPRAIPVAHWIALTLAVLVFHQGLMTAGYRPTTALLCAITLLFGRGLMKWGPALVADSLAISLAIAATGCFLATTARTARWTAWCGFVALTFLCYQIRPAYLFLIPLWPIVSLAADRLILRREAGWLAILRRGGGYAAATIIPFVLFCSLRWTIVGHWGLISFGGYNLVGVVGQFLDENSVKSLPAELQPVAQEMLSNRQQLSHYEPPQNFTAMEDMFNPTVWEIAVPAVQKHHGENPVVVNRVLTEISSELVRQHPREYVRWLVWNSLYSLKVIVLLTVTDRGTGCLCLLWLAVHGWSLWRGPYRLFGEPLVEDPAARRVAASVRFLEIHLLFWTALGFTVAKAMLVIRVEPANERYMTGAMPLLPAAFAVMLAQLLENAGQRGHEASGRQLIPIRLPLR